MELTKFYEMVEAHGELAGMAVTGMDKGNPHVIIQHKPSCLTTCLPVASISQAEWPLLEEVLVGKRDPLVLQHMTRVVGYFSRVQNWNRSKIGELNDRHQGNYALDDARSAIAGATASVAAQQEEAVAV